MLGTRRYSHSHGHGHRSYIKCKPRLLLLTLTLSVLQLLLVFIGAKLYAHLEGQHEVNEQNTHTQQKAELDMSFCDEFFPGDNATCTSALERIHSNAMALEVFEVGLSPVDVDWDFWNAVLFMVSTITTVGWGELSPRTDEGRVLSIIFIAIGVPVSLVLFGIIGVYLKRLVHHIVFHIAKALGMTPHGHVPYHNTSMFASLVLAGLYMLGITYYYHSGALNPNNSAFANVFEAFYFVMISVSTVGYGDLLVKPRQDQDGLQTMGFVITLYIGIGFFSLLLATVQHLLDHKVAGYTHTDTGGIVPLKYMNVQRVDDVQQSAMDGS